MSHGQIESGNTFLQKLLWVLIVIQVMSCLYITGKHVLFNSHLKLWFNQDYFMFQKLQYMLGWDYYLSQNISQVPLDSDVLVISSDTLWFLNYYLQPRRLYTYPGAEKDADLKKVPPEWIKEKSIDYILFYHPPSVKILDVGKDSKIR